MINLIIVIIKISREIDQMNIRIYLCPEILYQQISKYILFKYTLVWEYIRIKNCTNEYPNMVMGWQGTGSQSEEVWSHFDPPRIVTAARRFGFYLNCHLLEISQFWADMWRETFLLGEIRRKEIKLWREFIETRLLLAHPGE